jgi:hypothetical protein
MLIKAEKAFQLSTPFCLSFLEDFTSIDSIKLHQSDVIALLVQ